MMHDIIFVYDVSNREIEEAVDAVSFPATRKKHRPEYGIGSDVVHENECDDHDPRPAASHENKQTQQYLIWCQIGAFQQL